MFGCVKVMPYCEKCNVNTSSSGINSNVCSGSSLNPNLGVDFIYIGLRITIMVSGSIRLIWKEKIQGATL